MPTLKSIAVKIALLSLVLVPVSVHAQAATEPLFSSSIQENITWMVQMLIAALNLLAWVLFTILSYLIDPAFIFNLGDGNVNGGIFPLLNRIWVLARDLMNIAFAVLLIGAAIYTVVTAKKDFVAQYAPKFILSVILINFSWFVPRMIIDVANVSAATIYGIPSMLSSEDAACKIVRSTPKAGYDCTEEEPDKFVCKCKMVTDVEFFPTAARRSGIDGSLGWDCSMFLLCIQLNDMDPEAISGHSVILNGLIVNHARLMDLASVPPTDGESDIGRVIKLIIKDLFVLLLHVALVFPLLALTIAFFIRIPVLWLCIAFMPFVFLQFVVKEQFTLGYPQKIWEHFLKAAFLPAIVAIPFTIGFIMVNAGTGLPSPAASIPFPLLDGIGNFWQLMWIVMTMGVIWVGVFSLLEKMGIMGTGSQAIKRFGESAGRVAMKLPLSLPVIPKIGMSPLSAFKSFHPRNLELAMSQTGGLNDYFTQMREGRGDEPTRLNNAAKELKDSQVKFDSLKMSMDKLAEAMRMHPKDTAKHEEILRRIEGEFNISIDRSDITGTLGRLADNMSRVGVEQSQVQLFRDKIQEVKDEVAKQQAAQNPQPQQPPQQPTP